MLKIFLMSAVALGALVSTAALAGGNEAYTYEATFKTNKAVAMRTGPSESAGTKRQLEKGADGIVLRYCAPELSTGGWYFAKSKSRLKQLEITTCQVSYDGTVGFLDGKDLAFD